MKNESSKSGLFLMELILAILFFAFASAICARLFVASHLISRDTREENRAAALTQSAAACVQASDGDMAKAALLLHGESESGGIIAYYDADWQSCGAADAVYLLTVHPDAEPEQATAAVTRDSASLFDLTFGWHAPLT